MAIKKKKGRPSKYTLNQENEIKITVSEKDIEKIKQSHDIDLVDEIKEMISEEFNIEKVKIGVISEEEILEAPKSRTLADLSKVDLRKFQRTGIMPE